MTETAYWSYKIINKLGKSVMLDFFTNCSDLCLDMPIKGGDKLAHHVYFIVASG